MATAIKTAYGNNGTTITITLASLANNAARASTAVDNTSDLFLDALLQLRIKTNAAGTSSTGTVEVYAYGSADNGSFYTEGATGTDAGITLTSPTNARLIGVFNTPANATTYTTGPFSVAAAFSGVIPAKWGIIIVNKSGAALDATENSHQKVYQGVYAQGI